MSRDDAVHRCPAEKNAPLIANSTALSRSASSSTMSGFLPPISSCILPPRANTLAPILRPTAEEPVKVMPATFGCSTSAAPVSAPCPINRLNTPSGRPAREIISARAQAEPHTSSEGLKTTVLP